MFWPPFLQDRRFSKKSEEREDNGRNRSYCSVVENKGKRGGIQKFLGRKQCRARVGSLKNKLSQEKEWEWVLQRQHQI